MNHPVRGVERVTRVCPLGMRFWDPVTDSPVSAGLHVTAYPKDRPGRPTRAAVNHSGVFVLQDLPGLAEVERGAGDDEYWASLPPGPEFVVEVRDAEERFLPFRFSVRPPVKGLFSWPEERAGASPPAAVPVVPLYSSPVRAVPPGMTAVRATLYDPDAEAPAAGAVLEASVGGRRLGRGVADGAGRVALIVPYPEPAAAFGSPPAGRRLAEQHWTLALAAGYGLASPPPAAAADVLDLGATLAPPRATLWADTARAHPLTQATLRFGRELVLQSARAAPTDPDPRSALWVTAAGSPP